RLRTVTRAQQQCVQEVSRRQPGKHEGASTQEEDTGKEISSRIHAYLPVPLGPCASPPGQLEVTCRSDRQAEPATMADECRGARCCNDGTCSGAAAKYCCAQFWVGQDCI